MADERGRFDIPTLDDLLPLKSNSVGEFELGYLAGYLVLCNAGTISHEEALAACDKVLGNHGIETIAPEGRDGRGVPGNYTDEGVRHLPPFSYSNNGDSYHPTLVRDHKEGKWLIAGWADVLEAFEKEHKLNDYEEFDEEPERCPSCGKTDCFDLETFERRREPMTDDLPKAGGSTATWDKPVIGYYFACTSCNHHCQTAEDFEPEPDSIPDSDDDPPSSED